MYYAAYLSQTTASHGPRGRGGVVQAWRSRV